jgi:type VI secretion system secreted protein VgrG
MGLVAEAYRELSDALTQDNRLIKLHFSSSAPGIAHRLIPAQAAGSEEVCGKVHYTVQWLSDDATAPLKSLIGLPVGLSITDDQGRLRMVCGLVTQVRQLHADGAASIGELVLADTLSVLALRSAQRVFRDCSHTAIVEQIINEHRHDNPVIGTAFALDTTQLSKPYPARSMVVQYAMSDAQFIQLLLRQEGIAWHHRFEMHDSMPRHVLVLSDHNDAFAPSPAGNVRFHRADATEQRDAVLAWVPWRNLTPGSIHRTQYDYKSARSTDALDLTELDQGDSADALAQTLRQAHDDAPHRADGLLHQDRINANQAKALSLAGKGFRAESTVRALANGQWFSLTQHHEINTHSPEQREFIVTRLQVYARNNVRLAPRLMPSLFAGWQYLAQADQAEPPSYYNLIECVRRATPIVPLYEPDPRLQACMLSATVVGAPNQEIDVDEQGRIAVRFHFAQAQEHPKGYGTSNTPADSARIRTMLPWANQNFGIVHWPRVGSEVLVAFLHGDPSRPVALGCLYNGTHPPVTFEGRGSLPANAPLSGIRSKEVHGQRHNHLRLSDFTGQIGVQTASDHASTQLNQGWLGTPHEEGRSQPRGEGFELATDASGAVRTARGMLLSAFARLRASGNQLDRSETLSLMRECMTMFEALGSYASEHQGMPVDNSAQAEQHTNLQDWEQGSNTQVAQGSKGSQDTLASDDAAATGQGGAPMITITAPDGLLKSTPASVITHAGKNVDTVAVQHVQSASGGRTVVNAGQGVSTFAQSGGITTIAHQGDHLMQSQKGSTQIQSSQDVTISASNGRVVIMAQHEILLGVAGGAYIKISGSNIESVCPGTFAVGASSHDWGGPGSGSVSLPQFGAGAVGRQPVLVRASDGAAMPNAHYSITQASGNTLAGQTGGQGHTSALQGQAFEAFKVTYSGITRG